MIRNSTWSASRTLTASLTVALSLILLSSAIAPTPVSANDCPSQLKDIDQEPGPGESKRSLTIYEPTGEVVARNITYADGQRQLTQELRGGRVQQEKEFWSYSSSTCYLRREARYDVSSPGVNLLWEKLYYRSGQLEQTKNIVYIFILGPDPTGTRTITRYRPDGTKIDCVNYCRTGLVDKKFYSDAGVLQQEMTWHPAWGTGTGSFDNPSLYKHTMYDATGTKFLWKKFYGRNHTLQKMILPPAEDPSRQ